MKHTNQTEATERKKNNARTSTHTHTHKNPWDDKMMEIAIETNEEKTTVHEK